MKIMIVDDDAISRRILESFLKEWGYEVICVNDGLVAWEMIQALDAPNLVISDWMMPKMDGIELCKKIRTIEKAGYTYFILLTTKTEKMDIVEGLESGADDFIVKPFEHEELRSRVKIGERIINLEQRITQIANTDYLTGLLNRRAFMMRAEEEISRSLREHKGFSFIMADIDHFKKMNDAYGHQAGDKVLQNLARQLSKTIRIYDFVGRYGGEEFVICLPDTTREESGPIAERIRVSIEDIRVLLSDDVTVPIQVTASFGVSYFIPVSDENIDSVIKRADDALYRAKAEGRNRVCFQDD